MVRVPVFLSTPKSFLRSQSDFLDKVESKLRQAGLEPRTLGRSDYDMDAPLEAIRRLMVDSCGLLALAFRRTLIRNGSDRPDSDLGEPEERLSNVWLTSPYCQIEPAMAYQLGLPLLIWRQSGVVPNGLLDRGAVGLSMPEFDLNAGVPDLDEERWEAPFRQWVTRVNSVYQARGNPPQLWK